jgi:ADP-heptose:LPS heptosyltransferase
LANEIHNVYHLSIILLGSKDDMQICSEIAQKCGDFVVDLSGQMNIRITAAITSMSKVAVSNDSGPLHFAAAVGVPTIGIFGPTGANHKSPPGTNSYPVSLGLACSPCYYGKFHGCIFDRIRCMEDLKVEMVMKTVNQAMGI